MAQLRILLCSPSPPPLVLLPNTTLPARIPSLSLSSFQPTFPSPPPPPPSSPKNPCLLNRNRRSFLGLGFSHRTFLGLPPPMTFVPCFRSTALLFTSSFQCIIRRGTGDWHLCKWNRRKRPPKLLISWKEFEGRSLKLNYAKPKAKKPSVPAQPKQPLSFNLFVANLSFAARSEDLREFFSSEGDKVVSAGAVFQGNPGKSAGYGFVSFATKREADAALSYFQGKELLGRPIQLARSKRFVRVVRESNSEPEAAASESETILEQVEESKEDL